MGTCEEWPYVQIVRAGTKREDIKEIQNIRAGPNIGQELGRGNWASRFPRRKWLIDTCSFHEMTAHLVNLEPLFKGPLLGESVIV